MTALNKSELPKTESGDRTQESGLLHQAAGISETSYQIIILAISMVVILFSVYCLSHGITIIFMHLYYLPIVLLAYRYRYRGFVLSVIISLIYIVLVLFYSPGQNEVIIGAFIRFVVFIGIAAVVAYLSEQFHQSENSLKKVADIQKSSLMNANVWLVLLDHRGSVLLWNNAAERISGYSAAEVTGSKNIWKLLYPDKDYRTAITKKIDRILAEDSFFENLETTIRTRSGHEKVISWNTRNFPVTSEQEASSIAIGIDITERKVAEKQLLIKSEELAASGEELKAQFDALAESERTTRLSEERLIMAQEIGHTGCWEYDLVTDKIWGSAEGLHLFGFPAVAGAIPIDDIEACIPERERVHAALIDLINAGKEYNLEYAINPGDGSAPKVIHSIARLEKDAQGNPLRIIGIIRDITERKVAEERIRWLASFPELNPNPVIEMDAQGTITFANTATFKTLMGIGLPENPKVFIPEDKDEILRLLREGTESQIYREITLRNETFAENIALNTELQVVRYYILNITERKVAEDALRIKDTVFESSIAANSIGNNQGIITSVNPAFLHIWGYRTKEDAIGKSIASFFAHEKDAVPVLEALDTFGRWEGEFTALRKDGSTFIAFGIATVIKDETGKQIGYQSTLLDITERKVAEEQIRAEHDLVSTLASTVALKDTLPLCLATALRQSGMDSGGIYLVSETTGDLKLAFSSGLADEFVQEISCIRADSDSARLVLAGRPIYSQHLQLGVPLTRAREKEKLRAIAVIPILSKNRVIACFNIASHTRDTVPDESRTILESIASLIGNGIARFMAEEATRTSEERYRALFEGAAEGILVADIATESFLYANTAICRMLGYSADELITMRLEDIHPAKDLDAVRKEFLALARGEKNLSTDIPCLKKDKTIMYAEIVTSRMMIDKRLCNVGFFLDITERKVAEEFERVLARMVDDAPASITVHDFDGNFLYANEETLRLHGYSREEYLQKNLHEIDVPESEQLIAERMQKIHDMGEAEFDVQHFRKDGSKIPLHVNGKIIDWGGRKVLLSIATDLTERKVTEDALHLFKDLVEHSSDAIGMSTPEGKHYYQNETFDRLFGEIGENPPDTVYVDKAIGKHVFDTIIGGGSWQGEVKMFKTDRTILEILERAYAIKDPDGQVIGLVGLHTDITERKVAEDAFRRVNQKLNVLSKLTRKDLDNQIFVLSSYLEMVKHQLVGQENIIETLQKGVRAIQSIRKTIEYSKDYQDMGAKPQKWQNVNMAMLFGLSHISIGKIQHSLETEKLEIFADPLLEKVFQRLFENSVVHGDHVTRIRVWHTTTPDGVTIFFEDDGIGISAEKKEQIFLRDEGPSASMQSLIFVREILDITGITIRETGEPGKGARFEMVVPKGAYRFTSNP